MQRSIFSLLLALPLAAQSPTPIPAGSITAIVSPQGTEAMKQATGYSSKTSSLMRIDVCNGDAASDHNVSSARLVGSIILKEKTPVYSADVVKAVLLVLQQKDIFTRAQKIISAGGNVVVLLAALFKTVNPTTAAIVSAGPQIAAAILPAVTSQYDLAALAAKLLADNDALALGRAGSGNDCHTGLVVAMSPTVAIDSVVVQ